MNISLSELERYKEKISEAIRDTKHIVNNIVINYDQDEESTDAFVIIEFVGNIDRNTACLYARTTAREIFKKLPKLSVFIPSVTDDYISILSSDLLEVYSDEFYRYHAKIRIGILQNN